VSQTEGVELGQMKPANRPRHIPQRIAPGIPIPGRVVSRANADSVQDDDRRASHQASSVLFTKRNEDS
jgi:hypothetical protein